MKPTASPQTKLQISETQELSPGVTILLIEPFQASLGCCHNSVHTPGLKLSQRITVRAGCGQSLDLCEHARPFAMQNTIWNEKEVRQRAGDEGLHHAIFSTESRESQEF